MHGGGWTSNDRLTNRAIHEALAKAGIAVMAIDFRMPPGDKYPASIADVNVAIRWLKANAPAFGIAPDEVGALGTSSGGQQLLLAVMRPFDERCAALELAEYGTGHANTDATVPYVIACWPVADPLARYHMVKERNNQRLIDAHHASWPDEAAMGEGSPQLLLERGEAVQLPPALLLQGTNDDNLPPDSADRFATAYAKRGGEIHVEKFPGEPHTFVSRDPSSELLTQGVGDDRRFRETSHWPCVTGDLRSSRKRASLLFGSAHSPLVPRKRGRRLQAPGTWAWLPLLRERTEIGVRQFKRHRHSSSRRLASRPSRR